MQTIAKKTMSVRVQTRPSGAVGGRGSLELSFHEERIDETSRLIWTIPLDGENAAKSLETLIGLAEVIALERRVELAEGFNAIESARCDALGHHVGSGAQVADQLDRGLHETSPSPRCVSCNAIINAETQRCINPKCERVILRLATKHRRTKCGHIPVKCPKCGETMDTTHDGLNECRPCGFRESPWTGKPAGVEAGHHAIAAAPASDIQEQFNRIHGVTTGDPKSGDQNHGDATDAFTND